MRLLKCSLPQVFDLGNTLRGGTLYIDGKDVFRLFLDEEEEMQEHAAQISDGSKTGTSGVRWLTIKVGLEQVHNEVVEAVARNSANKFQEFFAKHSSITDAPWMRVMKKLVAVDLPDWDDFSATEKQKLTSLAEASLKNEDLEAM